MEIASAQMALLRSAMDVAGYNMTKTCADQVFKQAGFAEGQGRDLVGVVEL